jgi:hypothetical protein
VQMISPWFPSCRGQPAKRLGTPPRAAQERDEAGGAAPLRVQHLPAVHSDSARPPRDEIDIDDVDSAAEDHAGGGWDSDFGIRKEEVSSAAAPCVAFPAEHEVLES